jgi:hypothetical protein
MNRRLWFLLIVVGVVAGACSARSASPIVPARTSFPRMKGGHLADIYVADVNNIAGKIKHPYNGPHNAVLQIAAATGALTCVTGRLESYPPSAPPSSPPNIQCAGSEVTTPRGIAVDANGTVYVSDAGGIGIAKNLYYVKAGTGTAVCAPNICKNVNPYGIAIDRTGHHLYVAQQDNSILKIALPSWTVGCVLGSPTGGNGLPYSCTTKLAGPAFGIAVDDAKPHNVYVTLAQTGGSGTSPGSVVVISRGKVYCVTGAPSPNSSGASVTCVNSGFKDPYGIAVSPDCVENCDVFVADTEHQQVKMIVPNPSPSAPFPSSNVTQIGSGFNQPHGLAVSRGQKNVYVADSNHGAVWKISGFSVSNSGTKTCVPRQIVYAACNGTTQKPGGAGLFHTQAVALYF